MRLRDRVELHLEADAVLRLTPDYEAYLAGNSVSVIAEGSDRGLIVGQGVSGVAITGSGEIAAPGRAYIAGDDPEVGTWVPAKLGAARASARWIAAASRLPASGSPIHRCGPCTSWLVATCASPASGVENDRRLPNTDGLVIDSCHDVLVEGADISTADDGVCLKTTRRAAGIGTCERITVRNCRVSSQSCALKIGTESFGDVTDSCSRIAQCSIPTGRSASFRAMAALSAGCGFRAFRSNATKRPTGSGARARR